MHPLFAAHLIGDFLLQPTSLAILKQKKIMGIVIHALVHVGIMALLIWPTNTKIWILILIIAIIHGIIDQIKVLHQKKHGKCINGFLLDQAAHLAVLICAAIIIKHAQPIWHTEAYNGIIYLLIPFSFLLGAWNLNKAKVARVGTVACVFIVYIISGLLLAI